MPALPAGIASGTDAVAIRLADASSPVFLRTEMPNTSAVLKVNVTTGLSDNDLIMISDCASADIMQITQINTTDPHLVHNAGAGPPGNYTQELSRAYGPTSGPGGTRSIKFRPRQYFIKTGASGNPALFRQDNAAAVVELVDGIENLQILYGKDTDNDKVPNIYLKAGDAGLTSTADWGAVVSVRIGILARTLNDPVTGQPKGTALLEEKMSGNTQESTRSFQAAESGLIQVFNTATNYDVNSSQTNNFTYGSGKAEVVTEFVQYTTPRRSTTANSAVQFESANFNHKSTGTTTVGAKAVINLGVAQLVPKSN